MAAIACKFQKSIELLFQRKVYPSDLSSKLMEKAQNEIDGEIVNFFGFQSSGTILKINETYKNWCRAIYSNYSKVDKKWMKKHPCAFHPSEPRYKYPSIKDDVWDLGEDSPPIKTAVNRTLALDNESTPAAVDNSKYTFFKIILTISTYFHLLLFNFSQRTTINIFQASQLLMKAITLMILLCRLEKSLMLV